MGTVLMLGTLVGVHVACASPAISNVSLSCSAAAGMAEVSYELSGGPAIVTFDVFTNGVSIGSENYAGAWGDVWKQVKSGSRRFAWRPQGTLGGRRLTAADGSLTVSVKAWPLDDPPDYLVASLSTQSNVFYYTDASLLPGGAQSDRYRCDWLVMRRIPAAGVTWRMGRAATDTATRNRDFTHAVTLSRDYYMAVYVLTREQTVQVFAEELKSLGIDDMPYRPSYGINWTACRGNVGEGADWPNDGHKVAPDSFFGMLRTRTGLDLDYPTDAQWEYACRAGKGTAWNNGMESEADGIGVLGWYSANVGNAPYGSGSPQKVGLLEPNGWGLYDMHGNVWEFCLDWSIDDLTNEPELDPTGASVPSNAKVIRGGLYSQSMAYARSDHRNNTAASANRAIRLVCPVAMPDLVSGR